ncbi:MAG: hypothetical protein HY236_13090 [Acidobacteria bacterium]|nr:hypothetical protein [Acidobacteriota bacterium]
MPRSAWAAHLLALLFSLYFNPSLRWAGHLQFYADDYSHMAVFRRGERSLGQFRASLVRNLLTDEPLFNVYHCLRYYFLGQDPRRHHLLLGVLAAANALLAFSLVWRLSGHYLLSFLFLFFFLTYPNHGQADFWPATIYIPLLFLLLLSAHFGLAWLRRGGWAFYAACWMLFTAAAFTHETAFGFLAIFACLWMLERWGALRWPEGLRFLLPLALSSAAYLAVRQTSWFGFGEPGFVFQRPLQPIRGQMVRVFFSLRASFGDILLGNTWQLAGEALRSRGFAGLLLPLLGVPAAFLAVAILFRASSAAGPGAPDKAKLLKLAVFGAAWFFCAYAPNYVFQIAPRHNYLPSFGACLLLAVGFWLLAAALAERHGRLPPAAVLALAVGICCWFYAARLGETERWIRAGRLISHLKAQMLEAWPRLPPNARVVVLDVAGSDDGTPLLPDWGLQSALSLWYNDPKIQASSAFLPKKNNFSLSGRPQVPQHYEQLLLFSFKDQTLVPRRWLLFDDGTKIRVGAALGPFPPSADAAPLRVWAGEVAGTH